MEKKDYKIDIIGGGVSGLIAALVLEENGFSPTVIEATDRVGGRVKTDIVKGYQLDHGFQVLLIAYPAAKKYLDLDALELQQFLPGAAIFKNGKYKVIGDPLRDLSLLFPTLLSGIGNFTDKLKILQLNNNLKKKTLATIFETKEQSTLSYLQDLGFSSEMINEFFLPFFSGIFLEDQLATSSRMFEFIYKMFGEGNAALPKAGIEAIPKQLKSKLKRTKFIFNTKVTTIKDGEITLSNGEVKKNDFTITTTEPSVLADSLEKKTTKWKSCDTFYFETEKNTIKKPLIGLLPKKDTFINNIFYHTSLETSKRSNKELLSVTVVDNKDLKSEALLDWVKVELKKHCSIDSCSFIKHYSIPMALPNLSDIQYELLPSQTQLSTKIFSAGDIRLNGSLNAAMLSGEAAAQGIIEFLSDSVA